MYLLIILNILKQKNKCVNNYLTREFLKYKKRPKAFFVVLQRHEPRVPFVF